MQSSQMSLRGLLYNPAHRVRFVTDACRHKFSKYVACLDTCASHCFVTVHFHQKCPVSQHHSVPKAKMVQLSNPIPDGQELRRSSEVEEIQRLKSAREVREVKKIKELQEDIKGEEFQYRLTRNNASWIHLRQDAKALRPRLDFPQSITLPARAPAFWPYSGGGIVKGFVEG